MIRSLLLLIVAVLSGCASTLNTEEPFINYPLIGTYWVLESVETPAYRIDLGEAPTGQQGERPRHARPSPYRPALDFRRDPASAEFYTYNGASAGSRTLVSKLVCSGGPGWYWLGQPTSDRRSLRLSLGLIVGTGCDDGYWASVNTYIETFLPDVYAYRIEGDKLRLYFDLGGADNSFFTYRAALRPSAD